MLNPAQAEDFDKAKGLTIGFWLGADIVEEDEAVAEEVVGLLDPSDVIPLLTLRDGSPATEGEGGSWLIFTVRSKNNLAGVPQRWFREDTQGASGGN